MMQNAVRIVSRRGSVVAPARIDPGLRRGLVFMTFHFPDQVATNDLTIDAVVQIRDFGVQGDGRAD